MNGVFFEDQSPVSAPAPDRADVGCFVGLVAARAGAVVPAATLRWLVESRYLPDAAGGLRMADLWEAPIPVESFTAFAALFDWERRDLDGKGCIATTYLGAAVRSFFAQGGRKCFVVRVADPIAAPADEAGARTVRATLLEALVPARVSPAPADRGTWFGVGQVFGLPEVSFLCLPDLPDLVAMPRPPLTPLSPPPAPFEAFVECSAPVRGPEPNEAARLFPAPRCDEAGYAEWARVLNRIVRLFTHHFRVFPAPPQIIAAVPMPDAGVQRSADGGPVAAEDDLLRFLTPPEDRLAVAAETADGGLASPLLQLAYPWALTAGSSNLPERLEPPDGVLAGLLARNALVHGTFLSAALDDLGDVYDVAPRLRHQEAFRAASAPGGRRGPLRLADRVSILGPTPTGLRLLSDVTTITDETSLALDANEGYRRQGSANRLFATIVRAAQRLGEDSVFEASGERLWSSLRDRIGRLLFQLWQAGALRGASAAEAFEVRCDRSTMSRADIDQGRAVVVANFLPAAAIDRISVALSVSDAGTVSLAPALEAP